MPDTNFFSMNGPGDNGRSLRFDVLRPDKAWLDVHGPSWQDTLKITGWARQITVSGNEIHGGSEDCVDVNNHSDTITANFAKWYSGGRYVATVKGESNNVRLIGEIVQHGSFTDIAIGEWSDQGNGKTGDVLLNMTSAVNQPIRVFLANGKYPTFENDPARYVVKDLRRIWWFYLLGTRFLKRLRK